MKAKLIRFLITAIIFSVCMFFGELLVDYIQKYERDSLKTEMLQSIFIGVFVSFIFSFVMKNYKKKK